MVRENNNDELLRRAQKAIADLSTKADLSGEQQKQVAELLGQLQGARGVDKAEPRKESSISGDVPATKLMSEEGFVKLKSELGQYGDKVRFYEGSIERLSHGNHKDENERRDKLNTYAAKIAEVKEKMRPLEAKRYIMESRKSLQDYVLEHVVSTDELDKFNKDRTIRGDARDLKEPVLNERVAQTKAIMQALCGVYGREEVKGEFFRVGREKFHQDMYKSGDPYWKEAIDKTAASGNNPYWKKIAEGGKIGE